MRYDLEEIKKAKAKVVEGQLTIWNARLESLVDAGNLQAVLDHMTSPIEWGDNCDCQGNCNCAEPGFDKRIQPGDLGGIVGKAR